MDYVDRIPWRDGKGLEWTGFWRSCEKEDVMQW